MHACWRQGKEGKDGTTSSDRSQITAPYKKQSPLDFFSLDCHTACLPPLLFSHAHCLLCRVRNLDSRFSANVISAQSLRSGWPPKSRQKAMHIREIRRCFSLPSLALSNNGSFPRSHMAMAACCQSANRMQKLLKVVPLPTNVAR